MVCDEEENKIQVSIYLDNFDTKSSDILDILTPRGQIQDGSTKLMVQSFM